jgi:hypothetical protein
VDEACAAAVRVRERTAPDAEGKRRMDGRYKIFQAIYPALRRIADASDAGGD